jgi:SAM-dependent methyltransferase
MTLHPAAAGFARAADVYERARPEYPPEAVIWVADRLELRPGRVVVDVGAGTGKLTRLLVPTGARVVAIEPQEEMLAVLREAVPEAEALEGSAESLPLADGFAEAVTAASAFHWFEPSRALPEIARVLRPGGRLALVFNTRDPEDALQRELTELLVPHGIRVSWMRDLDPPRTLETSGLFEPPEYAEGARRARGVDQLRRAAPGRGAGGAPGARARAWRAPARAVRLSIRDADLGQPNCLLISSLLMRLTIRAPS